MKLGRSRADVCSLSSINNKLLNSVMTKEYWQVVHGVYFLVTYL